MDSNLTCPTCKQTIQIIWNFCPNCGTTLRKKPLSTSLPRQLLIYLVSFVIPILGFKYAFRYLREDNNKAQVVGIITIVVIVLSIAATIISLKSFMDYYSKILNNISLGRYP